MDDSAPGRGLLNRDYGSQMGGRDSARRNLVTMALLGHFCLLDFFLENDGWRLECVICV